MNNQTTIFLVFKPYEAYLAALKDYYHFFFAVLIPILEYHFNNPNKTINIISNIGNLSYKLIDLCKIINININYCPHILDSLSEDKYIYLYPDFLDFDVQKYNLSHNEPYIISLFNPNPNKQFLLLHAYDIFLGDLYYDNNICKISKSLKDNIINLFSNYFNKYSIKSYYDVIYIRRHILTNDELLNEHDRLRYRRSILNTIKFEKKLQKLCIKNNLKYATIISENVPLLDQFFLFHNAKIVIGQHGAGLSNIFFMKPNSYVVEISKKYDKYCNKDIKIRKYMRNDKFPESHFMNLANYCNINYRFIGYMDDFIGNINIKSTIKFLSKIIKTFSNPIKTIDKQYIHNCVISYLHFKQPTYSSLYWQKIVYNSLNNDYILIKENSYKYNKLYNQYIKRFSNILHYIKPSDIDKKLYDN